MAIDMNKDYAQEAIERAKAGDWEGARESLGYRDQKVAATGNNYGKTSADLFYELWDQYGGAAQPAQNQYAGTAADKWAGTDFAQAAIDAAKAGDWVGTRQNLNMRDQKIVDTGNNYGKTSADLFYELWDQYGKKQETTSDGFSYDTSPVYYDNYSAQIDAKLNALLNRDKFSYDAASDPLYQQYKSQYNREGQRAMQNTLGQVSARTGGMASSYAETAAQQANQVYAQQLADKIPELYQLAYEMYLKDIDLQVQDLGLLNDASDTAYNRYRDTMSDWRDDRNFAYDAYRNDIADGQWQKTFDEDVRQWQTQFDYNKGRDEIADKRYDAEWAHQVAQDALAQSNWEKEFGLSEKQVAIDQGYLDLEEDQFGYQKEQDALQAAIDAAKQKVNSTKVSSYKSPSGDDYEDDGDGDGYTQRHDPYADTRVDNPSDAPKYGKLSDGAMQKLNALKTMAGSIGSKEYIGNTIAVYADSGEITMAEAKYMFQYFGYDPSDWIEE